MNIERVLFTEEQIQARTREVAAEISLRYEGRSSIKLIGVLKGSVFFLTALAREISVPVKGNVGDPHLDYKVLVGQALVRAAVADVG